MFVTLPVFKELCLFTVNVNLNNITPDDDKTKKGYPTLIPDTSFFLFLLIIPAPTQMPAHANPCLFSLVTGKLSYDQKEREPEKN